MTRPPTHQPNNHTSAIQPGNGWHTRRNRPREPRTRSRARALNQRPKQPSAETRGFRANVSDTYIQVSPPGVIGGVVIQASRLSANLTRRQLARTLAVTPSTVRNWENGTVSLFAVPYTQICQLADALDQPGTRTVPLLTELLVASQCDLLITRMRDGTEDYAEPPPIDEDTSEGAIARDLLRWALAGVIPGHHEGFAGRGLLIDPRDILKLVDLGQQLVAGEREPSLVNFGIALAGITRAE
jgi:transcriptional regulator with XRE-family HTH domain